MLRPKYPPSSPPPHRSYTYNHTACSAWVLGLSSSRVGEGRHRGDNCVPRYDIHTTTTPRATHTTHYYTLHYTTLHYTTLHYTTLHYTTHKISQGSKTLYIGYVKTNLSLNALTADGSRYGKMDETTAKGYEPGWVAHEILVAAAAGESDVVLAPFSVRFALLLKALCPPLLETLLKHKFKT